MCRDEQSLLDIADSIQLISEYVENWDGFTQSIKDQDAVIHRLIIIGQAKKRLSMSFRNAHSESSLERNGRFAIPFLDKNAITSRIVMMISN